MNSIVNSGSTVSVPTSLVDQLQRMAKPVDAASMVAPQLPAPAPRPDPGPRQA
jgi:hypothetical protein